MPKGNERRLSRAEALLWEEITRSMKALPGRRVDVPSADQNETPRLFPALILKPFALRREPVPIPPPRPKPILENGVTHGIDKRTAERFRRGRMDIDARIDLHGLTEARAHEALRRFMGNAWQAGLRSVLIITGKGQRHDGGIGILRTAVPRWLNELELREKVLSFASAQPKDGGDGALYVLLKRQRV